ncbi:MAG: phosphoglucomutase/phosphomannomutase family protein [Deinococcales bacterium]
MEAAEPLVFGTDGWRDVIAERFTVAHVRRAARAYAEHLLARDARRVLVGHDTRFGGERFALAAARELAGHGLEVLLSDGYLPTPALSFAVAHYGAGGGVMLTASHNPPDYHGFKLKGPYGGTATDDIYRDVARRLSPEPPPARDGAPIERFDVREAYYDALERLLDMDVLASAEGRLVHDAMGGAACGWLKGFVRSRGLPWGVEEVRGEPHPLFYGVNPEPIAVNLTETREHMTASDAVFAAATDGDGDRLGVVLPGGAFFNAHQIFAVLLDELAREGRPGAVVKTFTVSRVVERLAALRGREVVETPVGFKYIVEAMLAGDVLIGGEESGGFGVAGHLPERDGIANALLLLQGVVHSGQPLAERFAAIERETGWRHAYDRLDLELSGNALKERVMAELRDPPQHVGGREVRSVERRDGVKLNLGDDAWLLYRPSGTEPVLRIYCEAPTAADVGALLDAARAWVDTLA